MTPVQAAFVALVAFWHPHKKCLMPKVIYSTDFVTKSCQAFAQHGKKALACYIPATKTIVLPDTCEDNPRHDCLKLLYHEMDRHVELACGHILREPEPDSVLAAEGLAP